MKCIVIGLDGALWQRVRKSMSGITNFSKRGVNGILKSTIPCNTCPALPSLYTGKNPGNLGIFDFIKPDGSLVRFDDFGEDVFWRFLGDGGYTSILFGTRITNPVRPLNGFLIPDDTFAGKYHAYPDFVEKILAEKGFFLDYDHYDELKKMRNHQKISEFLMDNLKRRMSIFEHIISEYEFDFYFLWIGHTDAIQHQCWEHENILNDFFAEVDDLIADLLAKFKFDNVIVISDHGFGTAARYNFHLNEWLYREGYLKMKRGVIGRVFYTTGYRLAESLIPDWLKKKLLNILKSGKGSSKPDESSKSKSLVITPLNNIPGVDWSKTIAHATTDKCWGIRIIKENLDRDYEEVRDEIIRKLKQLKDPQGRRVIKDAWRGEDIYWGKYQDQIPDVIFLKEDIFKVRPSLVGKMFTKIKKSDYVGNHDSARDGIFIAFGRDIKDTGEYIGEINIYDIAPTILHMYGIPIPADMDGRVLKEIFREGSDPSVRKVRYQKIDVEKELISSKVRELRKLKKL